MPAHQSQSSIEKRLKEISSKLSDLNHKDIIRETVEELKEKLLGSVMKRIEIIEGNMFEQAKEVESLKHQIEEKIWKSTSHETCLNDLEQYGRRNSVRITGLLNDNENQTSNANGPTKGNSDRPEQIKSNQYQTWLRQHLVRQEGVIKRQKPPVICTEVTATVLK
ncbi:hypothetical protein DPMN_127450 [Dreissena polymorpha]|uniref:Uncharacterized protein n=1 Tax=Dreissena polymorpha TaxID=45954 RepID=A0A9D4H189_DREPO|nr:hypothetical protein DPMN_127450 [Dreissena polymorpha]